MEAEPESGSDWHESISSWKSNRVIIGKVGLTPGVPDAEQRLLRLAPGAAWLYGLQTVGWRV